MTGTPDMEQHPSPELVAMRKVIPISVVMMLVSGFFVIQEDPSQEWTAAVPWVLAAGPLGGHVVTWLDGSWRTAAERENRALAT